MTLQSTASCGIFSKWKIIAIFLSNLLPSYSSAPAHGIAGSEQNYKSRFTSKVSPLNPDERQWALGLASGKEKSLNWAHLVSVLLDYRRSRERKTTLIHQKLFFVCPLLHTNKITLKSISGARLGWSHSTL